MRKQISNVIALYVDGFRGMTVGKRLWGIIFIKLFIMFAVLKVFFFPNYLNTNFETDMEKGNHVMDQLLKPTVLQSAAEPVPSNGNGNRIQVQD